MKYRLGCVFLVCWWLGLMDLLVHELQFTLRNAANKNKYVHLGFEKLARCERHQQTNERFAWQWDEEKMGFWGWRWDVGGRCPHKDSSVYIYKIRRIWSVYTQLEIIVRAYNTNIEINGCLKVGKKAGKKNGS